MKNNSQTTTDEIIHEVTAELCQETQKVFSGLLKVEGSIDPVFKIQDSLNSEKNVYVSVFITGLVYGEFVLVMSNETAQNCIKASGYYEDSDYGPLTESLNIISGKVLQCLARYYDKLTITSPRIYFGKILYPKFPTGIQKINSPQGEIECHFYYDRMELDLAISYQDTMQALIGANRSLTQVNEKLKQQQAQLVHSEKMASLGMMAAGIAHEINNPLAYVDSNISTLESYAQAIQSLLKTHETLLDSLYHKDKTVLKKSISEINRIKETEDVSHVLNDTKEIFNETRFGIKRIKDIVLGLKRFSHLDQEEFKKVDINDEIENMLKIVANQLKYKCEVVRDFEKLPIIGCFPGQLNQVFVNLLVNAAQAMPENEVGQIKISTRAQNDNIQINFSDTGSGIAQENIDKIFDPFFSTKAVGEGTGLGLSISYGIIKKHMGNIQVQSTVGKGTTFTVTLPLQNNLMAIAKE